MSIGTSYGYLVTRLQQEGDSEEEENMDKMGKLFFVITLPKIGILVKDLVHSLLKLKVRTVFQNVWGEYKYHGNPYIQGTIVPCDSLRKLLNQRKAVTSSSSPLALAQVS